MYTILTILNPNDRRVMSFDTDSSATSVNTIQRRTCDTLAILLPGVVLYPMEHKC